MKIQIKIFGEDPGLVKQLIEAGYRDARLVKGAVVFTPDINPITFPSSRKKEISLPVDILKLRRYSVQILVAESGGGSTNTGHATIVAGENGDKLKPYFVPTRGNLSNGDHAFFAIATPFTVVSVTRGRNGTQVSLHRHEIQTEGDQVSIVGELLWEGRWEEFPDTFSQFKPATEAAVKKSKDYHCRQPYWFMPMK